ncbi:MAG: HAD family hydrolase [Treponema sp.]|nr:HAD family hydrolase [Treponema sp.]
MENKSVKKGLIFDMDGTLWDSAENVATSWTETITKKGYNRPEITKEDIMSVMGKTMNVIADILFADLPEEERYQLLDECGKNENAYLVKHGGNLYPELEETLKKLKEKYHLYIVSNCQAGYIEAFLDFYGFGKYFEDIECYGNNLKQKGFNIKLLAERNNLSDAYYIGDTQGDYDATMEAGLKFIHAKYGFGTINAEVPELNSFKELPQLLKEIFF